MKYALFLLVGLFIVGCAEVPFLAPEDCPVVNEIRDSRGVCVVDPATVEPFNPADRKV